MWQKLVVLDVDPRLLTDDFIFTETCRKTNPGMGIFYHLKKQLSIIGVKVITARTYINSLTDYQNYSCYLVSDMLTPNTQQLLNIGVRPTILYSLESPNVAEYFYANLRKLSEKYKHTFLFNGFRTFTHPATNFHTLYWPNTKLPLPDLTDWLQREHLVMIAANKHKYYSGKLLSKLYTLYLKNRSAYPHNNDLYQARLEAILYFSNDPSFRLFGTGWQTAQGLPQLYFRAAQKTGAQPVADKIATLQNYRYSICFENCSYSTYITEKIFDCFYSGTIPVYLGAPDITEYIPSNCFIDYRHFKSFSELDIYLKQLSTQQTYNYLQAAKDFMESEGFTKFTEERIASDMMRILQESF